MAQVMGDALLYLAGAFAIAGIAMVSGRNLRFAFLGAGLALLAHFTLVSWDPAGFGLALAFVIVGAGRLASLLGYGRSGSILDHERELFAQIMQVEDPANQRRLRDVIEWQDIEAGEVLMRQGDSAPPLIYIAQGSATIAHNGIQIGTCGVGDFLGEMSVISGEQASATVIATQGMRIARFDRAALGEMVRHVPELGRAIDGALNRSLTGKLLRMNLSSSSSLAKE